MKKDAKKTIEIKDGDSPASEHNGKPPAKGDTTRRQETTLSAAAEKAAKRKPKSRKGDSSRKEKEALKAEAEKWRDQYLRKAAEFENFRKRKGRELAETWAMASAEFAKKLLPALDDLDRTLDAAKKDKNYNALVQGLELVHRAFIKVLEDENVETIQAIGEAFNPEFHEALLQIEKDGVEPNIVVDQSQKGYRMGDRILRPAKVIVSK